MIEAEIKDRSERLAESDKSREGSDDATGHDIVPIMNWAAYENLSRGLYKERCVHSSIVSAPAMRVAPNSGANIKIIFQ